MLVLNGTLRNTLIIGVVVYFLIILKLLKDKSLSLKYSLLWIFSGVAMGILVIFPELLLRIIVIFGIQSNMNGLFIFGIAFLGMILMSITSIVSRQNKKIRTLTQELAILEKRIRDIELGQKGNTDNAGGISKGQKISDGFLDK